MRRYQVVLFITILGLLAALVLSACAPAAISGASPDKSVAWNQPGGIFPDTSGQPESGVKGNNGSVYDVPLEPPVGIYPAQDYFVIARTINAAAGDYEVAVFADPDRSGTFNVFVVKATHFLVQTSNPNDHSSHCLTLEVAKANNGNGPTVVCRR